MISRSDQDGCRYVVRRLQIRTLFTKIISESFKESPLFNQSQIILQRETILERKFIQRELDFLERESEDASSEKGGERERNSLFFSFFFFLFFFFLFFSFFPFFLSFLMEQGTLDPFSSRNGVPQPVLPMVERANYGNEPHGPWSHDRW